MPLEPLGANVLARRLRLSPRPSGTGDENGRYARSVPRRALVTVLSSTPSRPAPLDARHDKPPPGSAHRSVMSSRQSSTPPPRRPGSPTRSRPLVKRRPARRLPLASAAAPPGDKVSRGRRQAAAGRPRWQARRRRAPRRIVPSDAAATSCGGGGDRSSCSRYWSCRPSRLSRSSCSTSSCRRSSRCDRQPSCAPSTSATAAARRTPWPASVPRRTGSTSSWRRSPVSSSTPFSRPRTSDFFDHRGVDPIGIVRALYADLRNEGLTQGGSTITQQYVKTVFLSSERTISRKLKEAVLAMKLERSSPRRRSSSATSTPSTSGVAPTAWVRPHRAYFDKDLAQVGPGEAAYLAGLIRAPESADAERDPEEAARRRRTALVAMEETGVISAEERDGGRRRPCPGPDGRPQRAHGWLRLGHARRDRCGVLRRLGARAS